MANPYRTPPPKEPPPRSPRGRLLTSSVAFGCACVVAGCIFAKSDSRVAFASAIVGGVLITRRPTMR
ncbi:MAG: hypothetical protein R3B70_05950 [Polyangiaceae bacterium]